MELPECQLDRLASFRFRHVQLVIPITQKKLLITMNVTELLTRNTTTTVSAAPDREGSFNFPSGIGIGDPFLDGVQLHAGLRLLHLNRPHLSPRYQRLWPVLASIRNAAATLGAERLIPEVVVNRSGITGRVDLRANGPRGVGHIEIKVVADLPDVPRQRDLRQMSLYLSLVNGRSPAWTALIYLNMADGEARYFVFSEAIPSLVKSAAALSCN